MQWSPGTPGTQDTKATGMDSSGRVEHMWVKEVEPVCSAECAGTESTLYADEGDE